MIEPDFPEFKRLSRKGNLIAVTRSVPADLETPVSSFLKLSRHNRDAFLLESAEQAEQVGRYSFIGLNPLTLIGSQKGRLYERRKNRSRDLKGKRHLVDVIEERLQAFKLANPRTRPGFSGGFVGFLSYENVEDFEDVKLNNRKGVGIPDGIFFLPSELLVFDHVRKVLIFVVFVEVDKKKNLKRLYDGAQRGIAKQIRLLRSPLRAKPRPASRNIGNWESNMTRAAFAKKVKRIKEYIRAGDCIQVVLSQRFSLRQSRDDFRIYRALRSINPSPYMFYFRSDSLRLIGSSPEVLVRKTGRLAEVRPIAGTRPRGATEREDLRYEENLKKSPKEMAEHLMLVDLGRNDLGRVCNFDTIHVKNFARVERFSHVMHLVSDVVGQLKRRKTAFDLLRATFPAGTVTGAPKIRAMEIINELEAQDRGPYAGCVGYFSLNQDMDMCITIRTLVVHGNRLYLQAGAGIVKDSNPGREYQETVNKAEALLKAVREQEAF